MDEGQGEFTINEDCRLSSDRMLMIIPDDPGEPPKWYPAFAGYEGIYVEREIFDKLKENRHQRPCDICPVNDKCDSPKKTNKNNQEVIP